MGLEQTWCGIPANLPDNMITKKKEFQGQNVNVRNANLYLMT